MYGYRPGLTLAQREMHMAGHIGMFKNPEEAMTMFIQAESDARPYMRI